MIAEFRMRNGQYAYARERVRNAGTGRSYAETLDDKIAVHIRIVDKEQSVGRILRMERQGQQAALVIRGVVRS